MNLQEALDRWPDYDEPTPEMEHLVLSAASRLLEGTEPDYEAAITKHADLWPVPLSARGEAWLREVIDAAVKGRILVEPVDP